MHFTPTVQDALKVHPKFISDINYIHDLRIPSASYHFQTRGGW
nr:MAG TPA: hypothetical protein [Caudoviricetes sp.]